MPPRPLNGYQQLSVLVLEAQAPSLFALCPCLHSIIVVVSAVVSALCGGLRLVSGVDDVIIISVSLSPVCVLGVIDHGSGN